MEVFPISKRVRQLPHSFSTTGRYKSTWTQANWPEGTRVQQIDADLTAAFKHLDGIQVTESENHTSWSPKVVHKRDTYEYTKDMGGNFRSTKLECLTQLGGAISNLYSSSVEYPGEPYERATISSYVGPILPCAPFDIRFPPSAASSDEVLATFGSVAMSRCSPSNPAADLAVTFGEFAREGIPRLIGGTLAKWRSLTHRERRRAIGDEHLNVEFGWKPLIQDLRDISNAINHRQKIIDQYVRDSGKWVRRRYSFPPELFHEDKVLYTNESPWWSPSSNTLLLMDQINKGKVIRVENTRIDRWFSGAFTYYVPPVSNDLKSTIARNVILARKLLGVSLTPDVLWNLAPWSWGIDWFSNSGEVIDNFTSWAIDNQVLAYGYIMEHSVREYTYIFAGPTGLSGASNVATVTTRCETKLRRRATPYGFGVSWDMLSPRQLSIVAALGLSRS